MFFAIIKKKKHFRNSHYIVCYMAAIIKFVLIIIFFYQFSPELIMPLLRKIPHFSYYDQEGEVTSTQTF